MSDLIERQAAIEKMEALADDDNLTPDEARGLSWCIRAIESLPSADRPTGEWIAYKGMQPPELHGKHYCSNCYHTIRLASNGNVYNYCPNCGARMEVEHELHYNECKPD